MEIRFLNDITLMLWILMGYFICDAEKLLFDQKPPPHAIYSGGIALRTPLIGKRAASDVGSRQDVGRSGGISTRPPLPSLPQVPPLSQEKEGVIREETEDLKIVDGKPVRVVKGRLGYNSPEGLPIAIKYEADENGNKASFTIGTATADGGGRLGNSGSGKSSKSGGKSRDNGKGGDMAYLPPMGKNNKDKKVDKSYLPPS